ncbi:aminotransferase class V-fold PLP-dependent enzyme [Brunnivagina elsteri]|uniref:Aminotransferase n=1 Tax=Brunnivagina elsteri CCALA 953 TaxID=987040 RepID=A0A2A2TNZ2_9CYAN|nr:aminotransferase class V-fold PLP-dependent enzyme [Calothrix elsteri]PAX60145.1 aminotransferase [Calothrix elsteri CCALA 953]
MGTENEIINSISPCFQRFWLLDRNITFLNHGSFGACPGHVLEVQAKLRSQLENEPLRFFGREWEPLLDASRSGLGTFLGADEEDLVFVPNATTGVNAVLRSLRFAADDELLTTNHEYNACRNALDFVASRSGAKVVVANIPFPLRSHTQIIETILGKVTAKTRLVLLDHITSQTGLIFPIQQLCRELQQRNINVLVDAAHAPGMIPVNLREIDPTYYTGNCHKWLCAPKGAAFLYVKREKQPEIRPLTISHGANSKLTHKSRFQLEFDWMGTDDPTAYMCVSEAIEFMGSLVSDGWDGLMQRNHELVVQGREIICSALDILPPCSEEMIGSMATIPLPKVFDKYTHMSLHDRLFDEFGIEVQIVPWEIEPKLLIRISAQIYNTLEQYEYLGKVLRELAFILQTA